MSMMNHANCYMKYLSFKPSDMKFIDFDNLKSMIVLSGKCDEWL